MLFNRLIMATKKVPLLVTKTLIWGTNSYVSKHNDYVEAHAYNPSIGGGQAVIVTDKTVDLSSISSLSFDVWRSTQPTARYLSLIVSPNKEGGHIDYTLRYLDASSGRNILPLNVVSLSGEYYIRVHATVDGGVIDSKTIRLYRILADGVEIWNASNPVSTIGI